MKIRKKDRIKKVKNRSVRRIVSTLCVIGVFAIGLGIVGYHYNLQAQDGVVVTRGVIDNLNQIPKTKKDIYDNGANAAALGSKDNPFLILEIVPYEEYAEFGYQISGCEPVDLSKMVGNMPALSSLNTATITQQSPAYFFQEEPEADVKYYRDDQGNDNYGKAEGDAATKSYEGYYEKVAEGEGYFKQDPESKEITFANSDKSKGGNIIWHTMCESEKEDSKQKTFLENPVDGKLLQEVGDRVYTKRTSSSDDPVMITYRYYYYKNNDNFLKHTLEIKNQDDIDNYSIVIKTITPKELNANQEWADYADLYILSPTNHVSNLPKIWQKYHRDGRTVTEGKGLKSFINTDTDKQRDLSWTVVDKMYQKINADKNYAPIIMDSHVFTLSDKSDDPYTDIAGDSNAMPSDIPGAKKYDALRTGSNLEIYDWNMKKTGAKYNGENDAICNNNVYKLAVMLFSMKPEMFQSIYLGGGTSLQGEGSLVKDGKFELRTGQDQDYWSVYTFLLADANGDFNTSNAYASWTDPKYWNNYESAGNIAASSRDYINGRVFTFNSGTNTTQNYLEGNVLEKNDKSRYTDFKDYMNKKYPNGYDKARPSDAVRYILNQSKNDSEPVEGTLKILDIEPSYDSKNGYSLTKRYIRTMIPRFKGDIEITHMTTAEFIGSSEDLNSTYNMIFIGRDDGAYRKEWNGRTKWNDSKMDGLIYFHTGDKMTSTEYHKYEWINGNPENWTEMREVGYLVDENGNAIKSTELRFPGNDITNLKRTELESFLAAGYPIISVPYAYDGSEGRIDTHSILYSFINSNKKPAKETEEDTDTNTNAGDKEYVYCSTSIDDIYQAIKKSHPSVEFTATPSIYNGETSGTKIEASSANYLKRDEHGRPVLDFSFKITDKESHNYRCKIYVDQNQDGKFDSDEVYYNRSDVYGPTGEEEDPYTVTCRLARVYMGVVSWKVEVYQIGNENVRFTESGISAVQRLEGTQKRKIKVLQIMPKSPIPYDTETGNTKHPYYGYMNLSTKWLCDEDNKFNNLFQKYYNQLDDYDIEVTTITLQEFQSKFTGEHRFNYDYSQKVTDIHSVTMSDEQTKLYDNYNMFILGFGDAFAFKNLSNEYGAVDFIKFYIASGKSVLFTHDMTSLYNIRTEDFGYTANTLLRDVMGMNRYGAISKNTDRTKLIQYRQNYNILYDSVKDSDGNALTATHGYTYYALKRLGWTEDRQQGNYQNQSMPYQYLITNTSGSAVCSHNYFTQSTGFNNNNDLTTEATKTNTGQITQYPYKIDDKITVAKTHGQWYQLDMEDSEVTTWYCLSDDGNSATCDTDLYGDGTAATYGISPNDAANNYYIYSKGNVFYSGIGHWATTSEMEAKLFINTMIAAYRATYEPPMIEILNDTAKLTKYDDENNLLKYEIAGTQEYNKDVLTSDGKVSKSISGDGSIPVGEDMDDYTEIHFQPVEVNAATTTLNCSIRYGDTNQYVKTIYHIYYDNNGEKQIETLTAKEKSDGSGEWIFDTDDNGKHKINNMDEYYFYYPNAYESKYKDASGNEQPARNNIKFKIRNNKSKKDGTTELNISTKMLFMLD